MCDVFLLLYIVTLPGHVPFYLSLHVQPVEAIPRQVSHPVVEQLRGQLLLSAWENLLLSSHRLSIEKSPFHMQFAPLIHELPAGSSFLSFPLLD